MHSRKCLLPDCPVPKCIDFRKAMQRRNATADNQRRAAYRQCAANNDPA